MTITAIFKSASHVIEFCGRLTYGPESDKRYEELCSQLERGVRSLVFDLRLVPDIDSAVIGFLVTCLTAARRAQAEISLAAPSSRVLHTLRITKLHTLFPVLDSVESALAA